MDDLHLLQDLIERMGNLLRAELRQIGNSYGLQPVHLQALLFLRKANRYSNTPQALTEYLNLTKGTVSQSLLLLYRKGLIERYADTQDNRVVRLTLSAQGKALLDQLSFGENWKQNAESIGDNKLNEVISSLRKLLQSLQLNRQNRTFGTCNSCRYFKFDKANQVQCGLTGETLQQDETIKICRDHVP